MKKMLAILLAAGMIMGMFTACGSKESAPAAQGNTAAEETAEGESAELTDFEVILDWYPNAIHSFMYWAQEKGYFAEQGLNVILTAPAGYSDGLTFPAAGKAKAGLYYMNDCTIGYADEGMDIFVLGAVTQETLSCMISLGDDAVTCPAEFAGKTVGYSGSAASKAQLLKAAADAGVAEDEFELVDVGFDIIPAITTGAVDVVAGGMINNEVVELRNAGYDVTWWSLEDYGCPREYDILFVVNKTDYEANPDMYEGFLTACKKGFADVKADPAAALDLLFEHEDAENYALDRKMEEESLEILLGIEEASGVEFTSMDADVWNTNTQWMLDNGLLKNYVDASEFANCQ